VRAGPATRFALAGAYLAVLILASLYPVGAFGIKPGQGPDAGSAQPAIPLGVIVAAVAAIVVLSVFVGYALATWISLALPAIAAIVVLAAIPTFWTMWVDGSGPIVVNAAVLMSLAVLAGVIFQRKRAGPSSTASESTAQH